MADMMSSIARIIQKLNPDAPQSWIELHVSEWLEHRSLPGMIVEEVTEDVLKLLDIYRESVNAIADLIYSSGSPVGKDPRPYVPLPEYRRLVWVPYDSIEDAGGEFAAYVEDESIKQQIPQVEPIGRYLVIDGPEDEKVYRQRIERQQKRREEANERAKQLLISRLTPRQREFYYATKSIYVMGSMGNMYEIECGNRVMHNVFRLDNNFNRVEELCSMLDARANCPSHDHFFAQMLTLQTDEEGFRRIANKWHIRVIQGYGRDPRPCNDRDRLPHTDIYVGNATIPELETAPAPEEHQHLPLEPEEYDPPLAPLEERVKIPPQVSFAEAIEKPKRLSKHGLEPAKTCGVRLSASPMRVELRKTTENGKACRLSNQ